jgi:DEAD/DEAH box helicase domain-containing protein
MDARGFVERLKIARHYRGQIAGLRVFEASPAQYREPATALPQPLRALLRREGIERLFNHQAESLDAIQAGKNVIVCTGTASGKSLCYHVPVLARLGEDHESRALYLFPAKALAYDQLGSLARMVNAGDLAELARPACYDGDTPTHKRPGIRRTANILLSNPDMLHQGILPYHAKWWRFFAQLKFVVVDEIHMYRGIFGTHVGGVIRRLRRVCRLWGSSPQFICCSATLGNPRELAQRLTGLDDMILIDKDGSPHGRRWFVLWNPPWEDERRRVSRRSGNAEAQALMQALLEEGAGTITFSKARVVAELIYKYLVESLRRRRPDLAGRVRSYRGGYLPLERREIEQKLFSGELLGVCSTNALELGIDVGSLDASISVGFPGTFCSLWQQAGRAGRRQEESLSFFVAYDDPIDQYLIRNPEFLFAQPLEHAIVDPDNRKILAAQLSCAARELRLTEDDFRLFGDAARTAAEDLVRNEKLKKGAGGYDYSLPGLPHHETSLRTISNATIAIVDVTGGRNEVIGQIDSISAPELVYPEAVYLHQGESYLVRELDQPARLTRVERLDADYYTQPVLADECRLGEQRLSGECLGGRKYFGDVTVRWQTIAFRKFKLYTQELIGQTVLDLPAQQIDTTGLWLQPPERAIAATRDAGYQVHEALGGVRNLLMAALPALAMCDRYDIGGIVNASQLGVSTIILYDRYEGGVGYARHGYECCDQLLKMAYDLVAGCPCENGCPGCVAPPNLRIPIHHDPDVGSGYAIPDKAATVTLLRSWSAP